MPHSIRNIVRSLREEADYYVSIGQCLIQLEIGDTMHIDGGQKIMFQSVNASFN